MTIPFFKAHGAGNDFLITASESVPEGDLSALARRICDRHTGVGADGWYLVDRREAECDAAIHLYNSDGSAAELSGNGTRCVAAVLVHEGQAGDIVRLRTGAGLRELRLLRRGGLEYWFEMNMGRPEIDEERLRWRLPLRAGPVEAAALDVGNPQCAIFVDEFPSAWETVAAEIESHPLFPRRTNVSFVRVRDRNTIEARFYERGAGHTLSSGTGSVGAAAAAIARGAADSPVTVVTEAGALTLRWDGDIHLTGPAVIVARGEALLEESPLGAAHL
jgi:diaminopimelate epimerase